MLRCERRQFVLVTHVPVLTCCTKHISLFYCKICYMSVNLVSVGLPWLATQTVRSPTTDLTDIRLLSGLPRLATQTVRSPTTDLTDIRLLSGLPRLATETVRSLTTDLAACLHIHSFIYSLNASTYNMHFNTSQEHDSKI